ncbi:MAG: hypothetical protein K6E59_01400 [Bacilli bacterium]|nr:hypothetical protein [Bacilli bacterium]
MKKALFVPIVLPLLLAGCSWEKHSIGKEEFIVALQALKTSITQGGEAYDNIRLTREGLFPNDYQFKRGEFYAYRNIGLALIIPINRQNYTWREGDHFYQAQVSTLDNLTWFKEISESAFNAAMEENFRTIQNMLLDYTREVDERLQVPVSDRFTSISNSYFKENNGRYKIESDARESVNDQSSEEENNFSIWFDTERLHGSYHKQNSSETTWHITYGDAQFTRPSDARWSNSSQE